METVCCTFLCKGADEVFMGNNLFTKGACYAAATRDKEAGMAFLYIWARMEMKFNLSLKGT